MSMIAMPSGNEQSATPKHNFEPVRMGEIDVVRQAASELVTTGLDLGVIDQGLVEFAGGMVGTGNEPTLVIPIRRAVATHQILASAHDPDTRVDHIYGYHVSEGKPGGKLLEWVWEPRGQSGNPPRYEGKSAITGHLEMSSSYVLATSQEELEKAVAWEQSRLVTKAQLEETGPLGRASTLVESAFGGIPIENPERAVEELSARMLMGALLERQHKPGNSLISFDGDTMLDPRLQRLFTNIYGDDYRELLSKVDAAARTATVRGSIEAARMHIVADMLTEDTARFLEKVWPDLERIVEVERLGASEVERIVKLLSAVRHGR